MAFNNTGVLVAVLVGAQGPTQKLLVLASTHLSIYPVLPLSSRSNFIKWCGAEPFVLICLDVFSQSQVYIMSWVSRQPPAFVFAVKRGPVAFAHPNVWLQVLPVSFQGSAAYELSCVMRNCGAWRVPGLADRTPSGWR